MNSTIVKLKCASKKEVSVGLKGTPNAINTQIELNIPYDQNNIFFQLSGGTTMILSTVNKEAADMFELGETYSVVISKDDNLVK